MQFVCRTLKLPWRTHGEAEERSREKPSEQLTFAHGGDGPRVRASAAAAAAAAVANIDDCEYLVVMD